MGECSLEWKKVFKEILGDKKQKSDDSISSSAEQCSNEVSSNLSNFKGNKSKESCTLDPLQQKRSFSCKGTESKLSNPKTLYFQEDTTNFIGGGVKQKNNANISQDNTVPEWNKVFKNILGSSPPVHAQEKKNINGPPKAKSFESEKHPVPVRNKRPYYPKKKYYSNFKKEMAEELEKKAAQFFASSVLLKPEISCHSLNDFAGTGVDIFKYDKRLAFSLSERKVETKSGSCTEYVEQKTSKIDILKSDNTTKSSSKSKRVHFADECTTQDYIKPDIPSGWVAKMKPLTSADILNAPIIPFDEPAWDDDLLYY